jgi:two-component system, response regulator PdtaR
MSHKTKKTLARVVIAEDEAIIRLDLKEILTSAGYDVVGETGRGDEAIQLVAEHQPDLAILDIKMPGMDGVRAAREITENHQVAVMLLTAFSQRDLIEEARDAGVAAYLVKPFQPRELLPAIADVLARARQEWALAAEDDTEGAEDKIATRRVVDEAKAALMDRHELSE